MTWTACWPRWSIGAAARSWNSGPRPLALCEPRLLVDPRHAGAVLATLDAITTSILSVEERRDPDFRVLRQALGYCWSVAVAALPEPGKAAMERWCASDDPDVRWIMRENLKKKRLQRIDPLWTTQQLDALHRDAS